MKCLATWRLAERALDEGSPAMLLYVLQSKGSSPGRQGFCMVVVYEGSASPLVMEGSIGGGIMEHKFVELAVERLKSKDNKSQLRKQYHDKSVAKDQSGMICSGEQTIFLYPLQEKDKFVISRLIQSLENNQNGSLTLTSSGITFSNSIPQKDYEFEMQSEDDWRYTEKTGYKSRLFIIGGGHCALALSKLMRAMDFYIGVYDDRTGLKTLIENSAAHEKHIVSDYSALSQLIEPGEDHYVVVMTMGYRSDDIALRALMGKKFRYVGVLGSRSKIQKMMDEYKANGIKTEWLEQIHAPIGLVIKSQSPEEIAVSIAAEIVLVKNG